MGDSSPNGLSTSLYISLFLPGRKERGEENFRQNKTTPNDVVLGGFIASEERLRSTLARFETWVLLVDHVDAAFASDDAAVLIAGLGRLK